MKLFVLGHREVQVICEVEGRKRERENLYQYSIVGEKYNVVQSNLVNLINSSKTNISVPLVYSVLRFWLYLVPVLLSENHNVVDQSNLVNLINSSKQIFLSPLEKPLHVEVNSKFLKANILPQKIELLK